jgi:hypothetical protein
MDHFSINQVRLGDGRPAAQYAVCVPDEAVNKDLESPHSELKKYLPKDAENDRNFAAKVAAILGGIVCAGDCSSRFNQFVSAEVPESTALLQKPANLGESTRSMLQNEYPGIKIWLLKTEIDRMPN